LGIRVEPYWKKFAGAVPEIINIFSTANLAKKPAGDL
jgi:hypothetical protein